MIWGDFTHYFRKHPISTIEPKKTKQIYHFVAPLKKLRWISMGCLTSHGCFFADKVWQSPTSGGWSLHPLQEGGRCDHLKAVIHWHWKHVHLPKYAYCYYVLIEDIVTMICSVYLFTKPHNIWLLVYHLCRLTSLQTPQFSSDIFHEKSVSLHMTKYHLYTAARRNVRRKRHWTVLALLPLLLGATSPGWPEKGSSMKRRNDPELYNKALACGTFDHVV